MSALPCSLDPMNSNASFDSNLIPLILNYLYIALIHVSSYGKSPYFLSPLLRFSEVSILIPYIDLDIFDDVSGITTPVIISHYCCSSLLP